MPCLPTRPPRPLESPPRTPPAPLPAVGILMAASSGPTPSAIFTMFTICQALFGVGVGGEPPAQRAGGAECWLACRCGAPPGARMPSSVRSRNTRRRASCSYTLPPAGEYPVASTSANERAENTKHLQHRRGET